MIKTYMKRLEKVILMITFFIIGIILLIKLLEFIKFDCIYRKLFNIYCPGCGVTRMIKSILKFDLYQAFRYNPLCFILFIISIPYFIYKTIIYIKTGNIKLPSLKLLIIIIVILFIYMFLRNIPKFDYLIPTKIN